MLNSLEKSEKMNHKITIHYSQDEQKATSSIGIPNKRRKSLIVWALIFFLIFLGYMILRTAILSSLGSSLAAKNKAYYRNDYPFFKLLSEPLDFVNELLMGIALGLILALCFTFIYQKITFFFVDLEASK